MEEKNLKSEVVKAVNSLDEITTCFCLMTNNDRGSTTVFGSHEDLVDLLAYNFKQQPFLLEIINCAVAKIAKETLCNRMTQENNEPKSLEELLNKYL